MARGKMIERGSHEELMEQNGSRRPSLRHPGKGLVADSMSLDFGAQPSEPNDGDEAVADDDAVEDSDGNPVIA